MRRNPFAVWVILAALLVEQSALARIPARTVHTPQSAALLPYAGSHVDGPDHEARVVRVTDSRDAVWASAPSSPAFNADSTRFFVLLDSVATLYSFDSSSLKVQKEGPLFERGELQSDGAQWSADKPGAIIGLTDSDGAIRIEAYDVQSRATTLVKDFSNILARGEARGLSKSWADDNSYAFSYREAGAANWRYVVVWDRVADAVYWFDLEDAAGGVAGFTDMKLDRSGKSLIVNGDWTRVWRYQSQPQHESKIIEPEVKGTEAKRAFETSSLAGDAPDLATLINAPSDALPRGNVSRDARFAIFNSRADGSRTDVFIATLNPQASGTVDVMWANMVNCSASDNTLQKTGGLDQSDDASGTSVQSIKSGDAFVEFTASETNKERWCGLNNSNAIHQSASDIDFAIKLTEKKKAMVCEDGVVKAKTKYKSGNAFRIAIESGVVNYYKKGQLFYTSSARPVYPLLVNASLVNSMSSVSEVMINGAGISPVVSISPVKVNADLGQKTQFTAIVTGVGKGDVIWSANGGTISSDGLYSAPSDEGTYTVTAKSAGDPTVAASASAFIKKVWDVTPPVISAVAVTNITANAATINWTTNEASDTQVEYGTSTGYGSSTQLNTSMVTAHSANLSGLVAGTLYHYRVRSRDAAGNLAVSGDQTFATAGSGGGGGGGGGGGNVITDKNVYPEPPAPALPAAGGTFRDPVFGTTIMRVTDERDGPFNVTNYSYYPSFNKDSTR
ncbi:MAG TPA: Ig and FN3 domain-containing protein, partial [Blastocatellia bacterium]|nr:Ig and FN3 domain-containing protein [Blastocatellia bacterium]